MYLKFDFLYYLKSSEKCDSLVTNLEIRFEFFKVPINDGIIVINAIFR